MAAEFHGEIDVPESAIQIIDHAVIEKLPHGTIGKSVISHGISHWTRTARLMTANDGTETPYFLKVSIDERGKAMMYGEFESMTAIHQAVPTFAPTPIAWGTYASDPNIHFYICSSHEMADGLPDIKSFSAQVAEMHRQGKSPNGKFGFHCTTWQGLLPQDNTWTNTWEEFYANGMKRMLQLEEEAQGPNEELKQLSDAMYQKVIPRLLRTLETGGRKIEPSLVHGDLWYGNATTDLKTGEPLIFDACCFYAHNEYELGTWRPARYKIGKPYIEAYHKHMPISAPVEDHDDRNALYAMRYNLHASGLFKGNLQFRNMVIDEMRRRVDRYPGGFKEWERLNQHVTESGTA